MEMWSMVSASAWIYVSNFFNKNDIDISREFQKYINH